MSIHRDVVQAEKISFTELFSHEGMWRGLGWGLCFISLLGFSPRLFHFQEYVFFVLLGFGILACLCKRRSLKIGSSLTIPFLLFGGWVAITIPFSIDPLVSLQEWQKVVAQFAVFYGTCLIAREQQAKPFQRNILTVLGLGTFLSCTYSLLDFWGRGGNIWDRNIRAGFPLSDGPDFTWLSTNVLMVLPMLAVGLFVEKSPWKKIGWSVTIMLAIFGLVFSYTRGVWLGFFVQVVLAVCIMNRRVGWWMMGVGASLAIVLVLVVASLGLHRETLDPWTVKARLAIWEMGVADILEHPIAGVGYGIPIFQKRHADDIAQLETVVTGIPKIPEKPHNWYLMIAMGSGLPGLLFFMFLLSRTWMILWAGLNEALRTDQRFWILGTLLMATGFFIRNIFDDSFGGSHSYLCWMLIGCSVVLIQHARAMKSDGNPSSAE
ncbi:MAG: O-antigen ligase family protein [Nitrospirales bacterium]